MVKVWYSKCYMNRLPNSDPRFASIPPEHLVIVELLRTIAAHTKEHGTRIQGQCCIEMPQRIPVVCMYASYPNGDYMCWFNDGQFFKMYALVNEEFKTVLEVPNTDFGSLQDALIEIQRQLDEANPQ